MQMRQRADRRSRRRNQRQVVPVTANRVCGRPQESVLQPFPQVEEPREVHVDLGVPGTGSGTCVHRSAIQIEVVLVAPELHEQLQLASRPPPSAISTTPEPKLL